VTAARDARHHRQLGPSFGNTNFALTGAGQTQQNIAKDHVTLKCLIVRR